MIDKYRVKVFIVSNAFVGTVIGELIKTLIDQKHIPADSEFVASSTEAVAGALCVKIRSSEFKLLETCGAIPMVDLRSKELVPNG
jgi:hypothetical protein